MKIELCQIIQPNNDIIPLVPRRATLSLKEIYAALDTDTFEIATEHSTQWYLLVDENAKMLNKPVNPIATAIFRANTKLTDLICGTAILCHPSLLN